MAHVPVTVPGNPTVWQLMCPYLFRQSGCLASHVLVTVSGSLSVWRLVYLQLFCIRHSWIRIHYMLSCIPVILYIIPECSCLDPLYTEITMCLHNGQFRYLPKIRSHLERFRKCPAYEQRIAIFLSQNHHSERRVLYAVISLLLYFLDLLVGGLMERVCIKSGVFGKLYLQRADG